jgi:hypothetical protein
VPPNLFIVFSTGLIFSLIFFLSCRSLISLPMEQRVLWSSFSLTAQVTVACPGWELPGALSVFVLTVAVFEFVRHHKSERSFFFCSVLRSEFRFCLCYQSSDFLQLCIISRLSSSPWCKGALSSVSVRYSLPGWASPDPAGPLCKACSSDFYSPDSFSAAGWWNRTPAPSCRL